jgi:hypothetical protein
MDSYERKNVLSVLIIEQERQYSSLLSSRFFDNHDNKIHMTLNHFQIDFKFRSTLLHPLLFICSM